MAIRKSHAARKVMKLKGKTTRTITKWKIVMKIMRGMAMRKILKKVRKMMKRISASANWK